MRHDDLGERLGGGELRGTPPDPLSYSQAARLAEKASHSLCCAVHLEHDPRGGWRVIIVEEYRGDRIEWAVYSTYAFQLAVQHYKRRNRTTNRWTRYQRRHAA